MVAMVAFFIQAITGILLLVYYVPHPDHAFQSIQAINNSVPYGWLFRMVHVVGSNIILCVAFLHLLFTLYRCSYKYPREMTWVSGAIMFIMVFLFCITGYLLSWNQVSYWSTTIITTMPTFLPLVGKYLAEFLRGGEFVSGTTLSRFMAFHVAFLPFIFIVLMGIHIFLVWRTGYAPNTVTGEPESGSSKGVFKKEVHADGTPYYPNFFSKEMYAVMIYLSVVFFIITFFPMMFEPGLAHVKADPLMTPEVIRPPWYFLAPYALLKMIPNKFVGISILLILSVLFLFWPFIDRKEERNIQKRPILRGAIIISIILWFVFTIWGRY
jgi:ubiquinol-cytochrome c reductase cytochrome b subunit